VRSVSLWLAFVAATAVASASAHYTPHAEAASSSRVVDAAVRGYVRETKVLHRTMGRARAASFYRPDMVHPEHSYMVWSGRLTRARKAYHRPPHRSAWLCIHRFEGAWTDGGAPYFGGLQMDWAFMRAYGARFVRLKGAAGNWTPLEQMWTAEAAYRAGRGFYPWPNTARMCGLI